MENKVESFKGRLSGRYVSAKLILDVINRVSGLTLVGDNGGELVLQNRMVDLDGNFETGELQIGQQEMNQGRSVTVHFAFAGRGVVLDHLWIIDTEKQGYVVSGVVLNDDFGNFVEIFAAAEVCCIYFQVPGLRSLSEPEYEMNDYIKA